MTDPFDATSRFGDRAKLYAAYRPAYPEETIAFLVESLSIKPGDVVADLGSGTGILSEPFLKRGLSVYGIEPNPDMRAMAETWLQNRERFYSVEGSAEATTLESASVDLAVAGQAFHWFDPHRTRGELRRIVKKGGACALIWNQRLTDSTPFLKDYDLFLRIWGTDYDRVQATYENLEAIQSVLGPGYGERTFKNFQSLDRDGLRGRLLSSSYVPALNDPRSEDMLRALDELFDRHRQEGHVRIEYDTNLYYARVLN